MVTRCITVSWVALLVSAVVVSGSFAKGCKRGTEGPDDMRGGRNANVFSGVGGNDVLRGFAGNDELFGGTGSDRAYGGADDDYLIGDGDSDRLFGGKGDDYLESYGDTYVDGLNGGAGDEDVCIAETIDRVAKNCEGVGRDDDKPGPGGIVCERGCAVLAANHPGVVLDKHGRVIKRDPRRTR